MKTLDLYNILLERSNNNTIANAAYNLLQTLPNSLKPTNHKSTQLVFRVALPKLVKAVTLLVYVHFLYDSHLNKLFNKEEVNKNEYSLSQQQVQQFSQNLILYLEKTMNKYKLLPLRFSNNRFKKYDRKLMYQTELYKELRKYFDNQSRLVHGIYLVLMRVAHKDHKSYESFYKRTDINDIDGVSNGFTNSGLMQNKNFVDDYFNIVFECFVFKGLKVTDDRIAKIPSIVKYLKNKNFRKRFYTRTCV